ncbi:MAG TPA: aldose 1-epimerase family protein [Bacteroidia bacterium]|nr:aldose 1-epimerase family protein [Bacteroidia bacterium]
MFYQIENNYLKVKFSSQGAEIVSIQYKNQELIWQALPVWKRHAPVLFPIIGKLKNDSYIYNSKIYSLPQHGFARDKEWINTFHSENLCEFELTDDEQTFQNYPFHFSLIIKYQLIQSSLKIHFHIFNPHHSVLPFSIGFHPAFNTFGNLNNCFIQFIPDKTFLYKTILKNGLLSNQKEKLLLENSTLYLNEDLFSNDAIVLENPDISAMILSNPEWNYSIKISPNGCKNWGIWTKCKDFICIEPWMGIADSESTSGNLLKKKDIILLLPYQHFDWYVDIDVFEKQI